MSARSKKLTRPEWAAILQETLRQGKELGLRIQVGVIREDGEPVKLLFSIENMGLFLCPVCRNASLGVDKCANVKCPGASESAPESEVKDEEGGIDNPGDSGTD